MIREIHGDILKSDAEALVNPVNTEGVMGAGLALQFKCAYPHMYREYRAACQGGGMVIGRINVYPTGQEPVRFVLNFPTKTNWRKPSHLVFIEHGLVGLQNAIIDLQIRSVSIPPLGCGLGGLRWSDVRALIEQRLGNLNGVNVMLYVPEKTSIRGQ